MPTNDTKQSNSYCSKHNTQHKAIFSYTLIPHLKLPTQILLRIANKKNSILKKKIFIPKEKNIFWHRQSIFQSLENIFQALEFKFQTLESRFQSLESSFTSGRKIFPIRRKSFSIVMQYFIPHRQKNSFPQKIIRSTYKPISIYLLDKFTAVGISYL